MYLSLSSKPVLTPVAGSVCDEEEQVLLIRWTPSQHPTSRSRACALPGAAADAMQSSVYVRRTIDGHHWQCLCQACGGAADGWLLSQPTARPACCVVRLSGLLACARAPAQLSCLPPPPAAASFHDPAIRRPMCVGCFFEGGAVSTRGAAAAAAGCFVAAAETSEDARCWRVARDCRARQKARRAVARAFSKALCSARFIHNSIITLKSLATSSYPLDAYSSSGAKKAKR